MRENNAEAPIGKSGANFPRKIRAPPSLNKGGPVRMESACLKVTWEKMVGPTNKQKKKNSKTLIRGRNGASKREQEGKKGEKRGTG